MFKFKGLAICMPHDDYRGLHVHEGYTGPKDLNGYTGSRKRSHVSDATSKERHTRTTINTAD